MPEHSVWTATDYDRGPFPENMMVLPTGKPDCPREFRDFYTAHNRAVQNYHMRKVGAMGDGVAKQNRERAILDMIGAVQQWADTYDVCGWEAEYILEPMLQAIGNALNEDCGRLDCAVLSGWIVWMAERYDVPNVA